MQPRRRTVATVYLVGPLVAEWEMLPFHSGPFSKRLVGLWIKVSGWL